MGSLITSGIEVPGFKDGDVGTLQKFEIFIRLFKAFAYTRQYNLTSGIRFLDHKKRSYIFTTTRSFLIQDRYFCFWYVKEGGALSLVIFDFQDRSN